MVDKIQAMYDEMYKSKLEQLNKNKENALSGIANKDTEINNNFNQTQNAINQSKNELQNRYNTMYSELDNQQAQGTNKFYNDRNQASYQNAKNVQALRDYMANRNLLASGESVDAQLRANTDFTNDMGSIRGSEDIFNKGIVDTRNKYQGEYALSSSKLDSDLNKAMTDKDQRLADLMAERNAISRNYDSDVIGLKSEIDAGRIRDINAYNEQLRQEQWRAEQERIAWERQIAETKRQEEIAMQQAQARSYASSGGSSSRSSSSGSSGYSKDDYAQSLFNNFEKAKSSSNQAEIDRSMQDAKTLYQNGYITKADYDAIAYDYNKWSDMVKIANTYSPTKLGGYSVTPRVTNTTTPVKTPVKTSNKIIKTRSGNTMMAY